MAAESIGMKIEGWACYGLPAPGLDTDQREAIIEYALTFEENDLSREELARFPDAKLVQATYAAMVDYARGQL